MHTQTKLKRTLLRLCLKAMRRLHKKKKDFLGGHHDRFMKASHTKRRVKLE